MAKFGKPDATGRSSGKLGGRAGRMARPPAGEPWAWITAEMLNSLAWRSLSANARRLLDFLLLEQCNHAGRENGHLFATHQQLRAYGLTNKCIRPAIEECERVGFLRYERGGRWAGTNRPSTFRLTFYVDRHGNPATNEWKAVNGRMVAAQKTESCAAKVVYGTTPKWPTNVSDAAPGNTTRIETIGFSKPAGTPPLRPPSISRKGTQGNVSHGSSVGLDGQVYLSKPSQVSANGVSANSPHDRLPGGEEQP